MTQLSISSAITTIEDAGRAGKDVVERALDGLPAGADIDLVCLFASRHHIKAIEELLVPILSQVAPAPLLGCTSEAVIGEGREIEHGPAVALWVASLPGSYVQPFHVAVTETPDGHALVGFPLIGSNARAVILLADQFTFPTQILLTSLGQDLPTLPIIGGMPCGPPTPGKNLFIINNEVRTYGATGVVIGGEIDITALVAQGCRPIGEPMVITAAESHTILEVAGRPALDRLRESLSALPAEEAMAVRDGIHVGLSIGSPDPDDDVFIIRTVEEGDPDSGALVVSEAVKPGDLMMFHLKDQEAADTHMDRAIGDYLEGPGSAPAGALIFNSRQRGVDLFGTPDHDSSAIELTLGPLAVAGMFCEHEIGPVDGSTYIQHLSSDVALFSAPNSGKPA